MQHNYIQLVDGSVRVLLPNQRILDYVKIDIEYMEWESLEVLLDPGQHILARVKQIALELHSRENQRQSTTKQDFRYYLDLLERLEQRGFRQWHIHFNSNGIYRSEVSGEYRTCCHEVVYVNLNFLRQDYE